jgi:25S rRNA (cytosine2870-C5)-methyltransferase
MEADFRRLSDLQKDMLLHAIDAVDANSSTGGVIVYATCSVTIDENEAVVAYALRKRKNVRIEPTGLAFGDEGYVRFRGKNFGNDMKLCRRYWGHKHNLDGFFVCRLRKFSNEIPAAKDDESESENSESEEETEEDSGIDGEERTKKEPKSLWDDEEDQQYIKESQMKQRRRKGLKVLSAPKKAAPADTEE